MHSSFLQFGRLHLPIYGICAALGLMSVLVLSQVTARRAQLDPDKVWDTVMALAVAMLVVSRALLVIDSFQFFLQHPMLVLTLPTVNDTALLLTAVFAVGYLRWKRIQLLAVLDALAPCGALLWAFLSIGRLAEGTRDGMPMMTGRMQQAELYTVLTAALLCAGLLRSMRVLQSAGRICAQGLVAGGAAVFLLDFLRLPADLVGAGILDPVQWLGLAMIVTGSALVIAVPAVSTPVKLDAV